MDEGREGHLGVVLLTGDVDGSRGTSKERQKRQKKEVGMGWVGGGVIWWVLRVVGVGVKGSIVGGV